MQTWNEKKSKKKLKSQNEGKDNQPYTAGLSTPRSPYEASNEEKSQYHFHKLSSATLFSHTLVCTFAIDPDPSSIFYTPLERGAAPVREYEIEEGGEVELMPDALAVRVGEKYISSDEIYTTPIAPKTPI